MRVPALQSAAFLHPTLTCRDVLAIILLLWGHAGRGALCNNRTHVVTSETESTLRRPERPFLA
eukprot:301395-Chlamydomonas_euryale.AAC.1